LQKKARPLLGAVWKLRSRQQLSLLCSQLATVFKQPRCQLRLVAEKLWRLRVARAQVCGAGRAASRPAITQSHINKNIALAENQKAPVKFPHRGF
jgi:hypothetical protein